MPIHFSQVLTDRNEEIKKLMLSFLTPEKLHQKFTKLYYSKNSDSI